MGGAINTPNDNKSFWMKGHILYLLIKLLHMRTYQIQYKKLIIILIKLTKSQLIITP